MIWSLEGPLDRERALRKLQGYLDLQASHGFSKLALVEKARQEIVGYCGFALAPIDGPPEPEFGFRLHQDLRGQGVIPEASRVILADAFERLGMPFVRAIVEPENRSSQRVLEKLGMSYERDAVLFGRTWRLYRLEGPNRG